MAEKAKKVPLREGYQPKKEIQKGYQPEGELNPSDLKPPKGGTAVNRSNRRSNDSE